MSSLPESSPPDHTFHTVGSAAAASSAAAVADPEAAVPSDVPATDSAPGAGARYYATALVAAALGGVAGYFLKPPPVVETDFVNFDAESTPVRVLGEGWSGFEKFSDGVTVAWCAAVRCTLNVSSTGEHNRLVRARLTPFAYQGAPQQTVTVYLNGTKIGSQPVPAERFTTLAFPAPQQYWLPGLNALSFQFAYAKDPKTVIPGDDDPRTLAATFDWVDIPAK